MNRVVHAFARGAPHITDVTVYTPAFAPNYMAFKKMKKLMVDGWFDHTTWRSLANCPYLESLELWRGPGDDADHLPRHDIGGQDYAVTFPTLKTLLINDEEGHQDTAFIGSLLLNTTMPLLLTLEVVFVLGMCTSYHLHPRVSNS